MNCKECADKLDRFVDRGVERLAHGLDFLDARATEGVRELAQHHGQPVGHGSPYFADHVGQLPASLGSSRGRYDAIRALVIAPALYRDPRFDPRRPPGAEVLVVLGAVERRVCHAIADARPLDQGRQSPVPVGANDKTHVCGPPEQLGTKALCHAPRDTEHGIAPHESLELTQSPEDALFGMLADRAGIHQDDVGAVRTVYRRIAVGHQGAEHDLGVAGVHLTAICLDVNGLARSLSHAG